MPDRAMTGRNRQSALEYGFTLLEVMVVVVIVAVLGGATVMAFRQATSRPYLARVNELESWLQVLSDKSVLEGTAYGVSEKNDVLQAMVYYRQHWFPVNSPAPFSLNSLTVSFGDTELAGNDEGLPAWIVSQFYIEGELMLQSADSGSAYRYKRNNDTGGIESENTDSEN